MISMRTPRRILTNKWPSGVWCITLGIVLTAAMVLVAHAEPKGAYCEDEHWITEINDRGRTLVLEDGSTWAVTAAPEVDVSLWVTHTEVAICAGKLINKEDDEVVTVQMIRGPSR